MPELPEVEIIKRGIEPKIVNKTVSGVVVRNRKLRWPITSGIDKWLLSQKINRVIRRGKYLILYCDTGSLIMHMGMSGSIKFVSQDDPYEKHDHFEINFQDGTCMRYNDPRRFGCVLWVKHDPLQHRLLCNLGVEPLSSEFNAKYLAAKIQNRNIAIKTLLMDSKVVVGVGNIYVAEVLFKVGIHPECCAKQITLSQCSKIVRSIKTTLREAIISGGTTIKDYRQANGKLGYFQNKLLVYGRKGQHCVKCSAILQEIRLGQRSTVFCPVCQALEFS